MSDLVYLAHHGIKGQEHGHRRFQNYDGSLTPAGRERYGVGEQRSNKIQFRRTQNESLKGHKVTNPKFSKAAYSRLTSSKVYTKSKSIAKEIKKTASKEIKNTTKNETIKVVKNAGRDAIRSAGAIFVANNGPAMLNQLGTALVSVGSAATSAILASGAIPITVAGLSVATGGYATYKYMKNKKSPHLAHHGIKGQEHGHRRFQNYDGSLTPAGRERYGVGPARKVSETIGKIKTSMSNRQNAKLERSRKKNEAMRAKVERIKESAYLKEERRRLNKEMKRAKKEGTKEAKGKYSRDDIKSLSDEEIQARLNRLQQESKLAIAEIDRNTSPVVKAIREALVKGGSQAIQTVAQNTLTDLGKKYLKVDMSTASKTTKEIETELRDKFNLQKLKDEMANYDQTRKDDELKRQTQRAQNMRDLLNAKKSTYGTYKSSEDKNKDQQRRVNERKELERRAKNFYGEGDAAGTKMTIEEVARRMGLTVGQVKDLLYI